MSSQDFIIISWGGIGDALLCTPTYRALKERYPERRLIVYCYFKSHADAFRHNPYIDSIRMFRVWNLWRYPRHLYAYIAKMYFHRDVIEYYLMNFQHINPSWIYEKNIKEIVPDIFDITLRDTQVQLFLTAAEEAWARQALAPYRNVVLMHIHSLSSHNHHWRMDRWREFVRILPDYTFIQLGKTTEPYVEGALDWRGKTTLRQAFSLLKHADSFVGVDSSLAHATNAFDLPGVVLFGDSSPLYVGHDNNVNIYKNLECAPCFYDLYGNPCPYGHECMEAIAVSEVKDALVRQMSVAAVRRMGGKPTETPPAPLPRRQNRTAAVTLDQLGGPEGGRRSVIR